MKINKVKQKTSLHRLNRASKFILLFDILPLFPHSEKMIPGNEMINVHKLEDLNEKISNYQSFRVNMLLCNDNL